jgi:hypothetical protein
MGGFAWPVARQAAVSGIAFQRCDLEQRERVTSGQTDRVAEARLEDFPV